MKKYADETEMNQKIEEKADASKVPFSFGIDSQGRYGYIKQGESVVTPFKQFVKVGTIDADYTPATLTINGYSGLTGEDIYVVPTSLTVKNIKDPNATESIITLMDCEVFKTYSNNKLTVWRTSIPGDTGVAIHCDVYIYY